MLDYLTTFWSFCGSLLDLCQIRYMFSLYHKFCPLVSTMLDILIRANQNSIKDMAKYVSQKINLSLELFLAKQGISNGIHIHTNTASSGLTHVSYYICRYVST